MPLSWRLRPEWITAPGRRLKEEWNGNASSAHASISVEGGSLRPDGFAMNDETSSITRNLNRHRETLRAERVKGRRHFPKRRMGERRGGGDEPKKAHDIAAVSHPPVRPSLHSLVCALPFDRRAAERARRPREPPRRPDRGCFHVVLSSFSASECKREENGSSSCSHSSRPWSKSTSFFSGFLKLFPRPPDLLSPPDPLPPLPPRPPRLPRPAAALFPRPPGPAAGAPLPEPEPRLAALWLVFPRGGIPPGLVAVCYGKAEARERASILRISTPNCL